MKEVFDKIIGFIHSEIARTTSYAEHDTQINIKFFVEKLRDEYNNGWIPCSERLPEEGAAVRVWLSFTNPITSFTKRAWWVDNHFEWDNGQKVKDKPLAWMVSLAPDPYQPKGE